MGPVQGNASRLFRQPGPSDVGTANVERLDNQGLLNFVMKVAPETIKPHLNAEKERPFLVTGFPTQEDVLEHWSGSIGTLTASVAKFMLGKL